MKEVLKVGGLAIVFMALSVAGVLSIAAEKGGAKALFDDRCSTCHDTDRPLGKTKTPEGWRQTVTTMQEHAAGAISDEERDIIIEYLSETRGK